MPSSRSSADRRAFVRFLAASPLMAGASASLGVTEQLRAGTDEAIAGEARALAPLGAQDERNMKSVKDLVASLAGTGRHEALNLFDLERVARAKLPRVARMSIGAFNNETNRANREGFTKYQIRLRRMMGVRDVDLSIELFGRKYDSPIFLCPAGGVSDYYQGDVYPGVNSYYAKGDLLVAQAARAKNVVQMFSNSWPVGSNPDGTGAGSQPEEVNAARGEPVWFNIRAGFTDESIAAMIARLERAGCPALVWTIDRRAQGSPLDRVTSMRDAQLTWADIRRVRKMVRMKLLLKGIVSGEDAALAVRSGIDAVIVSNHGGIYDASGRGAIDCLPEVVAGVAGKIPVLVDSGFRGGADIFKALALGATAVGIGRPYCWGLAAFAQEGVETVLEVLKRELHIVMSQAGASSIAGIRRASLIPRT